MTETTSNQEKSDRRHAELTRGFSQLFDTEKQLREENNHAEEFAFFSVLSATGEHSPANEHTYGNGWFFKFVLYYWSRHSPNSYAAAYRLGWQHALENQKNVNVRRAAAGRRLIGKESRAKVK